MGKKIFSNKKGFTLVELIAVIVLLGILAFSSTFFMPFFDIMFGAPKQVQLTQATNILVDSVIERNPAAWGLRHATKLLTIKKNQLIYRDLDNKKVTLYWNSSTKQLKYKVDGTVNSYQPLLYYAEEKGIKIQGTANDSTEKWFRVFKYLDGEGTHLPATAGNLGKVRQVELNWLVYDGENEIEVHTAVEMKSLGQ